MSIRDQILGVSAAEASNFKSEQVDVPEWNDAKVVVRELNIGDRNRFLSRGRKLVEDEDGNTSIEFDDPNDGIYLVVLSAFDEDGSRILKDSDVDALAQGGEKTLAALNRIVPVAMRLSGLGVADDEAVDEAGKDSSTTTPDGTDSLS